MSAEEKKITPEELLMECMAGAERITDVMVIVKTKGGDIEYWSSNCSTSDKLGMLCFVKANYEHHAVHGFIRE